MVARKSWPKVATISEVHYISSAILVLKQMDPFDYYTAFWLQQSSLSYEPPDIIYQIYKVATLTCGF